MNSRVSRRTSVAGSPIRRLLSLSRLRLSPVNPYPRLGRLRTRRDVAPQELLMPELRRENPAQRHSPPPPGRPSGAAAANQAGDPLGVPESAFVEDRRREQVFDPVRRPRREERGPLRSAVGLLGAGGG